MNLRKYRVGIIVVVIMIILQLILPDILYLVERNSKYAQILENDFRFGERVDKVVLEAFIDHIKKQKGVKIVFIGDSVVQGAMVKDSKNTIPAYYKDMANKMYPGENILVYNLAIPGNRPSDIYFTLKKIYDNNAADFVIMNVNYAFYSDEMLKSVPIARPDLFLNELDPDSAKVLGLKYSALEHSSQSISRHWNVYGMREAFSYYLFGKNPREKIFEETQKIEAKILQLENQKPAVQNAEHLDKPWWSSKPFPKDKITHWIEVFNVNELNDQNKGYWFLKKMIQDIKNSKIKTFAFFTPMNLEMIREYNLMQYGSKFESNMDKIKSEFLQSGLTIVDYTKETNSETFNDLFHLMAEGNKQVAVKLINDTKDIIKMEVDR